MSRLVADWLLTYLVHSSLLIGLVWVASRHLTDSQMPLREALWRVALLGGLLTASVQLAAGVEPWGGSWSLDATSTVVSPASSSAPEAIANSTIERTNALEPGVGLEPRVPPEPTEASPGWITRPDVDRWLVAGWGVGATLFTSLLLASYGNFRRRLSDRSPLTGGPLPAILQRLRERTGCRPVRLSRTERIGVPLARGVRNWEICLPSSALERLPLERQEIVVAHELAHLRRFDPLWFALQRCTERALFFQPLNIVARRELQEISEFRCDDWAVEVTRRPISLARCLTEVAEWNLDRRGSLPVPTLAVHRTQLGRRVARLLKRSYPMPTEKLPRWLAPSALALLALMVVVAPGVSSRPSEAALIEPELPAPPAPAAPSDPAEPVPPAPAPSPTPAAPATPTAPTDAPTAPAPPAPAAAPASPWVDRALPPAPPLPPRADLSAELWEAHGRELARLAESHAELVGGLEAELQAEWLPRIAAFDQERIAELAESAAALAGEWVERWESDYSLPHRLAPRLEALGEESRLEVERLQRLSAEIADRLPSIEELERLRKRLRAFTAEHEHLAERHAARMRELTEEEREARVRAHEEIRRSLEERRELLERARLERAQDLQKLGDEQRRELLESLRRARAELREQLRAVEQELAREDEDRERGVRE